MEDPEFVAILAYILRVRGAGLRGVRRSLNAVWRSRDVVPVWDREWRGMVLTGTGVGLSSEAGEIGRAHV